MQQQKQQQRTFERIFKQILSFFFQNWSEKPDGFANQVHFSEARSAENGCGEWHGFVWNRVRIWFHTFRVWRSFIDEVFFFFATRWKEHTPPPRIPSLGWDLSSLLLHFLTEENSSPRSMPDFWLFGDIKLTDHQKVLLDVPEGAKDKFGFPRKPPAATREKTLLWDNGVIPYEFDCSLRKWFRNYRTASTRTFLSYGVHLNIWCSLERLTFVDSITPLLSAIDQW